ncbi:MAG: hypothetical protein K0Q55_4105 [Verrucomicrobia bacterium]|nr:hypothetical protein [Verrucomicrobiota bacterium]
MNEAVTPRIEAMTEQELKKATRTAVLQVALLYPIVCLAFIASRSRTCVRQQIPRS